MKSINKITFLGLMAFLAMALLLSEKVVAQRYSSISMQTFYDELSPYGRWIHNPTYGYVWLPDVEPNFQPYATRGYWVMTEYGNTWVSDYIWGWAPFHYGRWYYDNYFGWAWVPGMEWGPAWVNWRTTNGYYGWAPLGPGMHIHMSINIPLNYWVFVPYRYITSPRIYNYYVPRRRVVNVYNQSVVINNVYTTNNYTYVTGPNRNEIERTTRSKVVVRGIDNSPNPNRAVVSRNSVQIYRPSVSENGATARPSRISPNNTAPSRREANEAGRTSELNSDRNRLNTPNTSRRENATENTHRERNTPNNGDSDNRRRSSTQEPTRRNQSQEAGEQQPVQRRQETRSQPAPKRQETQNAPVQRRQETQTQPAPRRQETQSAPAQRSQETQQPVQRRQETQAPAQQRVEPQQQKETRRSPETQNQAPARQSSSQEPPQNAPRRGR